MSSPKKRGEGTSCHHCKKRIRPNEMLKCTRGEIVPTNSRKRKVKLLIIMIQLFVSSSNTTFGIFCFLF